MIEKKYYKVKNNKFEGFYLIEQINKNSIEKEFFEITHSKWQELLNGQSQGYEIRILKSGELGLYKKPTLDFKAVKPEFNYETEKWEEKATKEEIMNYYENKLMKLSEELQKRERIGIYSSQTLLDEIEKYKKLYFDATYDLALEMNEEGRY